MATNWRALQQRLDAIVDSRFSEDIEFHPWIEGAGYASAGGPDLSRKVLKTRAEYVTPGAAITGESGSGNSGMSSQIVQSDVWASIQQDRLGASAYWVKGDRVFWPLRNEWFSISYIEPSATFKPNVVLIRVKDGPSS